MIRALAAAGAAAVSVAALPAAAQAPPPARVQVGAEEFALTLSRPTIKAGAAIVELVNYGEDAHDLVFRRAGGTRLYRIAKTQPEDARTLSVKLLPGTFSLWCSIADHRARGMQARLVVAK